jgi:hypothetical protein
MRFWFSGPRIMGIRPGIRFGPEDFRSLRRRAPAVVARNNASSLVYVVKSAGGRVQIGTNADPIERLAALQAGAPGSHALAYVAAMKSGDGFAIEQAAQNSLAGYREGGGWFEVSPAVAIAAIQIASARLQDPIVAIPVDKLALTLKLAAAPKPLRGFLWIWEQNWPLILALNSAVAGVVFIAAVALHTIATSP